MVIIETLESIHPIAQTLLFTIINVLTTILGASVVFSSTCIKFKTAQNVADTITVILFGCSSGVMIYTSIFSLLIPAKEILYRQFSNLFVMILSVSGFIFGIVIMWLFDLLLHFMFSMFEKPQPIQTVDNEMANEEFESVIEDSSEVYLYKPKIEEGQDEVSSKFKFKRVILLFIAMVFHSLPDGLLIGTAFAAVESKTLHFTNALILSSSVALQNILEGAIVALPCQREGISTLFSFLIGSCSALLEPLGGLIGLQLTFLSNSFLPYLLTFSAGSMCFVVFHEMLPVLFKTSEGNYRRFGAFGMLFGFLLMMAIDILLQ